MNEKVAEKTGADYKDQEGATGIVTVGDVASFADQLELKLQSTSASPQISFASAVERFGSVVRLKCAQQRSTAAVAAQSRIVWPVDVRAHRAQAELAALERLSRSDPSLAAIVAGAGRRGLRMVPDAAPWAITRGVAEQIVPKARARVLGRDVIVALSPDPALRDLALRLFRAGILYLGQLVQLPYEEIEEFALCSRPLIARLEVRLAALGLRLSSRAPRWTTPAHAGFAMAVWRSQTKNRQMSVEPRRI
jgi:hypothetical protein